MIDFNSGLQYWRDHNEYLWSNYSQINFLFLPADSKF